MKPYQSSRRLLGDIGLTSIHLSVKLIKDAAGLGAASEGIESQDSFKEVILQKTDYDRFAENFEKWAMENRPLFVLLSVTGVILVISLLSTFQNKLK